MFGKPNVRFENQTIPERAKRTRKADYWREGFQPRIQRNLPRQTNRLLEDYSADGLHLNLSGYRQVSKYIFDKWLKALLDQRMK